jgi:hypothetical protein
MHAGLACISKDIAHLIHLQSAPEWIRVTGTLLANGIAAAVKMGHIGLEAKGLLVEQDLTQQFFDDNLAVENPSNGAPFYQGRFLIRTLKPGDDLNVKISFCPDPDGIYTGDGGIKPDRVITAEALTEDQADAIEGNPDEVDLVIRFKEAASIVALFGQSDVDTVGLLLDNVVQLDGNIGHLFKIGAIASDIMRIVTL